MVLILKQYIDSSDSESDLRDKKKQKLSPVETEDNRAKKEE